jgi:hypothetical protein
MKRGTGLSGSPSPRLGGEGQGGSWVNHFGGRVPPLSFSFRSDFGSIITGAAGVAFGSFGGAFAALAGSGVGSDSDGVEEHPMPTITVVQRTAPMKHAVVRFKRFVLSDD